MYIFTSITNFCAKMSTITGVGEIILNKEIKLSVGPNNTAGSENYYMSIYENGSFIIVSEKIYGQSNNCFRSMFREYIVEDAGPLSKKKVDLINCVLTIYDDVLTSMIITQFRGDEMVKILCNKLVNIIEKDDNEDKNVDKENKYCMSCPTSSINGDENNESDDECRTTSTPNSEENNESDEDENNYTTELTEKSLKIHTLEQTNNDLTFQLSNLTVKHKQLINTTYQFVLWNTTVQIFIMGFVPRSFYAVGVIATILYNYWMFKFLK